jgi:protoheme IX farnesyltransferase
LGAGLAIAGAIALNQRMEVGGDAKMARTAGRPLPSGRLSRKQVTRFGIAASVAGLAYLAIFADAAVVLLTAASWAIYVWAYTPLKSRSAWQTPIGAVAGAVPALLGAAVADAALSPLALSLFGIVYFWQLPHSMAIAWLYRDQFAAAGVRLPTVVDPSGRTAGITAFFGAGCTMLLGAASLLLNVAGRPYAPFALLLGVFYTWAAGGFLRSRNEQTARRLLRASLEYLPLLLAALLLTKLS